MSVVRGGDGRAAERNLQVTLRAGQRAAEDSLTVVGLMITNAVKVSITKPPVSAPDTPPALRTGGLRLSYRHELRRTHGKAGSGKYLAVFSDRDTVQPVPPHKKVIYASYLEYGTSQMAARPHLRPAVAAVLPMVPGIIATAWAGGIRGGTPRGRI